MLYLAGWLENQNNIKVICHTYYEKPSTSPLVFHGRGACSIKQKIVILGEEVKRRMLNQDRYHTRQERVQEMVNFSQKTVQIAIIDYIKKK